MSRVLKQLRLKKFDLYRASMSATNVRSEPALVASDVWGSGIHPKSGEHKMERLSDQIYFEFVLFTQSPDYAILRDDEIVMDGQRYRVADVLPWPSTDGQLDYYELRLQVA